MRACAIVCFTYDHLETVSFLETYLVYVLSDASSDIRLRSGQIAVGNGQL